MDVYIFDHFRLMQPRENGPDPIHHVRRELPRIIFFEKPFQPSVLKTRYHALTVARSASPVNWNLNTLKVKSSPGHKDKGIAHHEGSGQVSTGHPALRLLRTEYVYRFRLPSRAGRVTSSHPGCPRQQYRLVTKPRQSPIRIKAWIRRSRHEDGRKDRQQ